MTTLDCIKLCLQAYAVDISPYFTMLSQSLSSEVFGDSKTAVREAAQTTALALLDDKASNIGQFIEKVVVLNLRNKSNWRVRSSGLAVFSQVRIGREERSDSCILSTTIRNNLQLVASLLAHTTYLHN